MPHRDHAPSLLQSALHAVPSSSSIASDHSDSTHIPYSRPPTPHDHHIRIGFAGLGAMGYPMARNIATSRASHPAAAGGPPVLVWNRTKENSEKLVKELGESVVSVAQDLEQIARDCDVILTSLATDVVIKDVYEKFSAALTESAPTRNKIFVEMSTIYPALAGELDGLISAHPHTHFIMSPVFGAPAAADKAQLIIAMSGDYRSKKELAYLFVPSIGKRVIDLGGNIEKAATFKLIGNSIILGALELLGESYTLGEKSGIGAKDIHELVKQLLPSPALIAYGDKMIHDKFDGSQGFSIDGGIKDASHIRRLTAAHGAPMPIIDVAHQHLVTARALHHAQVRTGHAAVETLDWSAIVAGSRVAAGLDGLDSSKHAGVVRED